MATTETIPDFTEEELTTIRAVIDERYRYGKEIELELADAELRLETPSGELARELTLCPTVFWQVDKVSFVIFKLPAQRYRCQFFYSIREQYGTGIDSYDDIGECVTVLLQIQADHEGRKSLAAE